MVVTKYITLNSTLSSIYRLFMADWFREDVREKCINCANSTLRERRVGLRCALGHGIWAQKVGKKKRKRRGGGIGWRSIFSLLDLMIDFEWTSLEWCSIQVVPVISHFFCYFKLPVAPPDFCPRFLFWSSFVQNFTTSHSWLFSSSLPQIKTHWFNDCLFLSNSLFVYLLW